MTSSVLSEGDAEYVDGQNLSQILSIPLPNQQAEDAKGKEEPCNVCFDKPPDAVLMNCGHGGAGGVTSKFSEETKSPK